MSSFLLTLSLIWTVTFTSSFLWKALGILIFLIDVLVGYMQWVEWWLFTCSVVSHSLHPCGLQHTRLPCHSLSPGVCSNSCPLSWWCHPTISSSVTSFSFCLHSFPISGSFPVSWLFTSDGQSIGVSSPSHEYSRLISFRIDWFDYLAVQGTLKSLLQHHSSKASTLGLSAFFIVQFSHPYMETGNTIALTRQTK